MTEKKKPKPIRLTKGRALALLDVFGIGERAMEDAIRLRLLADPPPDLEETRVLKAKDVQLAAARDAAAIVRHRYLGGEEPTEPTPTLF